MAVNDNSNNHSEKPQAAQQQSQPGTQQHYADGTQAYQQRQQPQGMSNVNHLLQRSGSYDRSESRSAEALRGLREAAAAAIEAQGLTDDFELIRFDRDANRVGLSSILVVKTTKLHGGTYAAVRTLLLDSDQRLRPRVFTVANQRVEAPTRAQHVYNDFYWARITEFLRRSRGIQDLHVVDAGPLVITPEVDFKDDVIATRLLVTSVNRCDDVIARLAGEAPFTIGAVKRTDERLTARIDFTGEPVKDLIDNPIRADIRVTMNRQAAGQQQEDDFYERESSFNSVAGFINLEYAPPTVQPQPVGWGQQPAPTQLFVPTFVITDVSQADWVLAQTPELWLLAVSNAYRVTAGTAWVRSFIPQVGKKGVDPRDIGALGYMTQAGQKIDTKSGSFSEQDFVDLMTALVRPNPTFLIDVNPVGEHAAIENYLIDAAFPTPNQGKAIERLVRAADNLTGNLFSQKFNARETPIVLPYEQEIHLGYYIDEDGEKRDIRDLDVLAVLNQTEGNINDFNEWYRTYVDTTIPNELRLQRREQMERNYLSKSLKITGTALRLLLTPQFIEALDAATREAGVQVDFENVTNVMGTQRFTGNTMAANYSISRNAQVGYTTGPSAAQAGYQYAGVTASGRIYN